MQIRTVVSPLLATNCYVVLDGAGSAVVVDPGAGVTAEVLALIDREQVEAAAVLVTHGHVDHTWSAGELCAELDLPLHVHERDRPRIDDPFGTLGPLGHQLEEMARSTGQHYRAPDHVVTLSPSEPGEALPLDLPGLDVVAVPAPGHTEGSTVYLVDGTALTGDVLFAGTIGRTDLPGGDPAAMARTLRRLADLDPATRVLPGHGPESTVGRELETNPYLHRSS